MAIKTLNSPSLCSSGGGRWGAAIRGAEGLCKLGAPLHSRSTKHALSRLLVIDYGTSTSIVAAYFTRLSTNSTTPPP